MSIYAASRPATTYENYKRPCERCGIIRFTGGGVRGAYCIDCVPLARELGWAPRKAGRQTRTKKAA